MCSCCSYDNCWPSWNFYFDKFSDLKNYINKECDLESWVLARILSKFPDHPDKDVIDNISGIGNKDNAEVTNIVVDIKSETKDDDKGEVMNKRQIVN